MVKEKGKYHILKPQDESELVKICSGKMCPSCKSKDVFWLSCAPDGMNVNNSYKCRSCLNAWEGY
ncbi:MAG: hypothetical protein OCC45_08240 [Desulfotalea sp.]